MCAKKFTRIEPILISFKAVIKAFPDFETQFVYRGWQTMSGTSLKDNIFISLLIRGYVWMFAIYWIFTLVFSFTYIAIFLSRSVHT